VGGARQAVHSAAVARVATMAGLAVAISVITACKRPPEVREIPAERDGGQVTVRTTADREVIEITSPKGIGAATVALAQPARPLRFTFHLRGLEQLHLSYDDVQIAVAVKANGETHERLVRGSATERGLAAGDPYWMRVEIEREAGGDATAPIARIHLDGPAALQDAAPESCRIDWVDFFR
jgi:hypothetical protein